jgi:hypothetical protein
MKLLAGLVLGLVAAKRDGKPDRKVPPRHPSNRLNRLANKLAVDILQHPNLSWSDKRKDRVLENLQNFADKMLGRFQSDNCGYYNSELKHGGPDPEPHMRESGRPRNPTSRRRRRDIETFLRDPREAENWQDSWWIKEDSSFMWLYEYCFTDDWSTLSDAQFEFILNSGDDLCEDEADCEYFDLHSCQFKNGDGEVQVRGKRGGRKLSDNPQKAWKQVTTGLKKWAQRYLNNCHGMRKDKLPANRAKSMYNRWVDKFPTSWN